MGHPARAAPNLENKVVRACVELAAGKADTAVGLVRIFVDSGKVQVKHLAVADDLRKGQFLYGEPMIRAKRNSVFRGNVLSSRSSSTRASSTPTYRPPVKANSIPIARDEIKKQTLQH